MKKTIKQKIMASLVASSLMFTCLSPVLAWDEDNVGIILDKSPLHLGWNDQGAFIKEGRTLVPIRIISTQMDCKVDWNAQTQTATVTDNKNNTTYVFTVGKKAYTNNGKEIALDVAPIVVKGRTMLPIRPIGEMFGSVEWDKAEYRVIITPDELHRKSIDKAEVRAELAKAKDIKLSDLADKPGKVTKTEWDTTGNASFIEPNSKGEKNGWERLQADIAKGDVVVKYLEKDPYNLNTPQFMRGATSIKTNIDKGLTFAAYAICGRDMYQIEGGGIDANGMIGAMAIDVHTIDYIGVKIDRDKELYIFPNPLKDSPVKNNDPKK